MFQHRVAFEIVDNLSRRVTVDGVLVGWWRDLQAYYLVGGTVYCYHVSGNYFSNHGPYGAWCQIPGIQRVTT